MLMGEFMRYWAGLFDSMPWFLKKGTLLTSTNFEPEDDSNIPEDYLDELSSSEPLE